MSGINVTFLLKRISSASGVVGPLARSEEHTSELQSPCNLVCRLLLEKKKTNLTTLSSREPDLAYHPHLATHLPPIPPPRPQAVLPGTRRPIPHAPVRGPQWLLPPTPS